MSLNIVTPPAPKKRGRGRPKIVSEIVKPDDDLFGSKQERLQQLYAKWYGCQKCSLGSLRQATTGNSDIVFGEGNANAHIIIVGEAPGEKEESTNIPFVGPSGELLNQLIAMCSDDPQIQELVEWYLKAPRKRENIALFHKHVTDWRHREFFLTNAVACHPPENATPSFDMVKICWPRLWNIIYTIDPLLIVPCGNSALSAVLQKAQVKITAERGKIFDITHQGKIGKASYPVMPVFHTSYLMRKADWRVKGGDWKKSGDDWKRIMRVLDFLRHKHYGTPIPDRRFTREVMFI
jgi:DNA polymerase